MNDIIKEYICPIANKWVVVVEISGEVNEFINSALHDARLKAVATKSRIESMNFDRALPVSLRIQAE